MKIPFAGRQPRSGSAGITLTEILISIMILGIGLVSLATLFPIGLLRLREGARYTRSAYLAESAAADMAARGLLNSNSFTFADRLNVSPNYTLPIWYPTFANPTVPGGYSPLIQDSGFGAIAATPAYGPFIPYNPANPDPNAGISARGNGLPFAYDPLWRFQTGIYLDPINNTTPEARFGSGIHTMRTESDGHFASAHGLQRLTNFNRFSVTVAGTVYPVMTSAASIPSIFISPEDYIWQEGANASYVMASDLTTPVVTPSPVLPDMNLAQYKDSTGTIVIPTFTNDWRFSWMVTAQQASSATGAAFDGNLVIFENRPFSITHVQNLTANYFQVDGETVVEAVYGASKNVFPVGGPGYGAGADRTVLLRWPNTQADPVVKVGDWFADVTYERNENLVVSRFSQTGTWPVIGVPNPLNNNEWDNLPAQRCFWYQILKLNPPADDPNLAGYRSMTVYVDRKLNAKTLLNGTGQPIFQNAALICPFVVNVIPQTFFVR
jgi:type II secretory pathway pseudopilin PulG